MKHIKDITVNTDAGFQLEIAVYQSSDGLCSAELRTANGELLTEYLGSTPEKAISTLKLALNMD